MKVWRAAVQVIGGEVRKVSSKMEVSDARWKEIVVLYDGYQSVGGSWWYIEVEEDDDGFLSAT